MNAPTALRFTARRTGRYYFWVAIFVGAVFSVFVVKAAVAPKHVPARHFEPSQWHETAVDLAERLGVEKP